MCDMKILEHFQIDHENYPFSSKRQIYIEVKITLKYTNKSLSKKKNILPLLCKNCWMKHMKLALDQFNANFLVIKKMVLKYFKLKDTLNF